MNPEERKGLREEIIKLRTQVLEMEQQAKTDENFYEQRGMKTDEACAHNRRALYGLFSEKLTGALAADRREGEQETRPIPISAAQHIAEAYGYEQVVIIARHVGADGVEHCTTYGVDKANCDVAARIGDFLKFKVMNWMREDQPYLDYQRESEER